MSYSKQNFRSGDTLYASQLNAMDDEIAALEAEVESTKNMVGSPLTASTAVGMTDQTKIYVYTGTETGYTAGHWYYYNGTAWTDGGVYNSVAVNTDTSLTVSGQAADSKAVGDAIDDLDSDLTDVKSDLRQTQSSVTSLADKALAAPDSDATGVDLDVTDPSGNVIVRLADGHIQTKNFDSEDIEERVTALEEDVPEVPGYPPDIMESDASDVDLDITDTHGNVVARFTDGHIKTKNFDSSNINTEEIDALSEDVSDLKDLTTGILGRNRDIIDGIYAACRWHQRGATDKQFCMLLGGDPHNDPTRLASLVEFFNVIDAFDCGIILGDIVANDWRHDATYYTNAIKNANKPFLTCVGNHDAGSGTATDQTTIMYTNIHDFWAKFFEPNMQYADLSSSEYTAENTYYYKDFASQKIRIIVLNQYEYPADLTVDGSTKTFVYTRGYECYSQAQITWFCNTLLSTPSDYGVIIALHSFPAWMAIDKDSILTSSTIDSSNTGRLLSYADGAGFIIEEIVQAWITGVQLTKTWLYTVSGSWGTGVNVNVNFASRGTGEFITYIGGHWHMALLTHTHKYLQPMYTVEATGLSAAQQGDTPRKAGTMSEDCFAALAVDRSLKTVKIFQIGAHYTKDAVDRRYGKYSYAVEEG